MSGQSGDLAALFDEALGDPAGARSMCDRLLAGGPLSEVNTVHCLRARGLARRNLGDLDGSAQDLEQALVIASTVDDAQVVAGVRMTLAGTRVFQGQVDVAKALLQASIAEASGALRAEGVMQLGTTHAQAGELDDALMYWNEALPLLRAHGRSELVSNLLGNIGVRKLHLGEYTGALSDLDAAIDIQLELGVTAQAALNLRNKAQVHYMSGDIGRSLDTYRQAEELQNELGMPVLMYAQKCDAYLAMGLFEECLALAQQSHQFVRSAHSTMGQIQSLMPGAEAALALGDTDLAGALIDGLLALEGVDQFPAWAARARLTRVEARAAAGTGTTQDVATAHRLAADTRRSDTFTSLRATLLGAQIQLALGDPDDAIQTLERTKALASKAPLHLTIHRWQLLASARHQLSNRRGVLSAVRAGLRSFDLSVQGVSSYAVRVKAGRHAEELTGLGVRELLGAKRYADAVQLIEQLRAGPVVGAASMNDGAVDTEARTPHIVELATDETVLTWVEIDDTVLCLSTTAAGTRLSMCGALADIAPLAEEHRFVYRQLSRRRGLSGAMRAGLVDRCQVANRSLSSLLLPERITDRVLLNPSPSLYGLLWGGVPGLVARQFTIVPAAHMSRRALAVDFGRVALLGSSELAHVASELDEIARLHNAEVRVDPGASAKDLIEEADLVHLAGHFVADGSDPLLSGLPLGEWRLRGLDYLQMRQAPTLAVLSACSSGDGEAVAGSLVGFATAALSAGTASVIATQSLVEDGEEVVAAMTQLHKALTRGRPPAEALRQLRVGSGSESLVAPNMTVLGVGW